MALSGSRAEADELVQEVLLHAHDAFPTYRAEGTVRAWLFGIARRLCARHLETRTRQRARLRLVHDATRGPGVDDLVIEREDADRARRALGGLKASEREAVLLRYEGGLSFREVAIACGVDEQTARKRVSRAIVRLRAIVEENDHVGE
jgi:RNA polymerase sigma-70 factor (ECF subfamily)